MVARTRSSTGVGWSMIGPLSGGLAFGGEAFADIGAVPARQRLDLPGQPAPQVWIGLQRQLLVRMQVRGRGKIVVGNRSVAAGQPAALRQPLVEDAGKL